MSKVYAVSICPTRLDNITCTLISPCGQNLGGKPTELALIHELRTLSVKFQQYKEIKEISNHLRKHLSFKKMNELYKNYY